MVNTILVPKHKEKLARIECDRGLDLSPVILWLSEKDGSCSYLSQQWYKCTGQTPEQSIGFGWLNAAHPEDRQMLSELFFRANLSRKSFSIEFRLKLSDGTFQWMIHAGNPRKGDDGTFLGYAGSMQDIHAQKKAAEEVILAKQEAKRANQSKSSFLANMSHEIRTPLGAILGFTELLNEASSPQERDHYTRIISRNGKALTKIIDDILDLSKVEAGRLEVEKTSFDIIALISDVRELFSEILENKKLLFAVVFDSRIPNLIRSDPTRIRQILINLIGNAVKFTFHGEIKMNVEPLYLGNKLTQIQITIRDTGVGMSAEQRIQLFEPFSQADNSSTRKFGGSGLGLVLSRRLAKALGGNVWVESSVLTKGSTFVTVVDASASNEAPGGIEVADDEYKKSMSKHLKVLLVEDSPDNQMLVERILVRAGMDVEIAKNGQEAVDLVKTGTYDVILMDMQMPVLDGYAATTQLRKSGYSKPVIALTAHAMAEERRRTFNAGCDAHLTKPLDFAKLVKTISQFAHETQLRL